MYPPSPGSLLPNLMSAPPPGRGVELIPWDWREPASPTVLVRVALCPVMLGPGPCLCLSPPLWDLGHRPQALHGAGCLELVATSLL